MESEQFVFCIDAECVRRVWEEHENFLIAYDERDEEVEGGNDFCAVYFSSNDIYYPDTEEVFRKRIVERNAFEWYGCRIKKARKHIFLRDVFKQWYVKGINATLDNTDKVAAMLRKETSGYRIVTIGSSAGGYAAILYGTLLKAEYVMAFNAQLDLNISAVGGNKLLISHLKLNGGGILNDILREDVEYFYFFSNNSPGDVIHYRQMQLHRNFNVISFNTSHHGIPFLKVALKKVLELKPKQLKQLCKKRHNPIMFTIRQVGLPKAVMGFIRQVLGRYRRRK